MFDSLYPQVCQRPTMHLLDTPGVLPPKIESVETGMKLALCGKQNYYFRETLLGGTVVISLVFSSVFFFILLYILSNLIFVFVFCSPRNYPGPFSG